MLKIESARNETFKKLLSLTGAKGLKEEKLFLLGGERLVREYLQKPRLDIVYELRAPGMKPLTKGETIEVAPALFTQLDVSGTHFNLLVLKQPEIKALTKADIERYQPQGIEVVIPIGDPANLGALLRSCEAFGVLRVILTQEAAHPFLPKAVKASAGSVLRLPISRGPALKDFPATCLALDSEGASLYDFAWPKNGLLVVGEEGAGLGRTSFKRRLGIPMKGVESLNATVAASIALAFKAKQGI